MEDKLAIAVNGRRYLISCAPDRAERLRMLGQDLDARMQELAETLGDIGNERLFFALGLALLDELENTGPDGDSQSVPKRRAIRALVDAASRLEAIAEKIETGALVERTSE